jgi:hypothetical protein
MISLDAGQREPVKSHGGGGELYIPKYAPTSAPQGDSNAVQSSEAARQRRAAGDRRRAARTENGVRLLLARRGAPGAGCRYGRPDELPKTHHLSAGVPAVAG